MAKRVLFSIQPAPTFTAPVKIPRPGEEPAEITVTFKHMTREQMSDFIDRSSGAKKGEDVDLVMEMVSGWSGVDTPFSAEAVGLLIENYQGAIPALLGAFISSLTEGRRKN